MQLSLKKYKIGFLVFLLVSAFKPVHAQEKGLILSKYYSPVDYNAGTQNWAITQDKRGVLYFGNASGILEYDGVTWELIRVANNSTVRSLAFDKNNVLYAGAYDELGCLTPDKTGNLKYNSLNHLIDSTYKDFGEIWDITCFSDTVFFLTDNFLFRYANKKFDYWENKNERFYLSHKIGDSYYVQEMGKGLLKFKNDSLSLIKGGDYFSEIRIHTILQINNKLFICTRDKGLYIYDDSGKNVIIKSFSEISSKTKELNNYFIKNTFYHGIEITDKLFALSTVTGNIIILDNNWNVTDVINNETIGIKSPINYLYHQKNHSLWLALGNGISQVEILSPFRYWNDEKGVHGTISDVAELNNNLYVATGSGVFYTNKPKEKTNFTINSFSPVEGTFEQAWEFLYFQHPSDKDTFLFVASSQGLFHISNNESKRISNYNSIFRVHQYKKDLSKLFLGLDNGIALISFENGKWIDHGLKYDIHDKIRDINEDSLGNLWLSAFYKGLYKIKNPLVFQNKLKDIELLDTLNGLPSINSIEIYNEDNELYFLSNGDFYTYSNIDNRFYLDTSLNDTNDSEPIDTLSFYRLIDDIISNFYVTTYEDPYTWFGTTKGIFRMGRDATRDYFDIPPALIRQVSSGDSIIYNGTNFKEEKLYQDSVELFLDPNPTVDLGTILKYHNNFLTFQYSFPFFEEESKNVYSYFLEGYDKNWSEWTSEHKKEYTNLREGDYVFKVKAKNIYQLESSIAEFKFKILPPWYRNFGAYMAYIIIGILFLVLIVKLYTYRLIKEKDKLEKIVIERTQEILMQKEEILVQAEHLKEANEGISKKNEELEKQKQEITNQAVKLKKANIELIKLSKVASETNNAIAIFDKEGNIEWVNDGFTRLYGYTLEQFKKEKCTNIIDGSDNPNIKEVIRKCINEKESVVYEFKTISREGKELWTQTTLTHVIDKDGKTLNLIAIDSDITKIKQAEKKIAEQRDKLALSNATKNKFFSIIAHDLRNPISTLAGSTNLIFNDFDDYNKEQTKNFIGELNKLSQTTFNLLENLLDWSLTQMGEIVYFPKSINLLSIAKENIELIKRKIDSKNIKLKLDIVEKTIAFADENMVKTILRNLLSNAVKFTPENGEIEISTYIKNDIIHCIIKDTGIGIQEENLNKLFKIDQHHTTLGLNNEKGSGLGLILCKEFVENNGGEIKIDSVPNKGTTIEFTLKQYIA